MPKPPEFLSVTCPTCNVPHTLRWIEPPGAWFGDCPRLVYRSYDVNGEVKMDVEFMPKPRPDRTMMILKSPADAVTNYQINGLQVKHTHRPPGT